MTNLEMLKKAKQSIELSVSAAEYKPSNGGGMKDWLPMFRLKDHNITARLVMDLKGEFSNEYCEYWIENVPVYDEATGETKNTRIRHRVKGVWNEARSQMDYYSNDALRPLALELGKMYPGPNHMNPYASSIRTTMYAEVIEMRDAAGNKIGGDDKHKIGPCVLVDVGFSRSFAVGFNTALNTLLKRAADKGKATEEKIASYFNPQMPGILCDIKRIQGGQGKSPICIVDFDKDSYGHTLAPEVVEKFADIKNELCVKFDATNERNREILMEHFKRLLSAGGGGYASPDPVRPRRGKVSASDDDLFSMDTLDAAQSAGR